MLLLLLSAAKAAAISVADGTTVATTDVATAAVATAVVAIVTACKQYYCCACLKLCLLVWYAVMSIAFSVPPITCYGLVRKLSFDFL